MDGTEVIKKPKVVEDYNQYMGGVDKSDQLVLYYGFAHRRVKWWERAFFHLMDLCLVNAHILYNNPSANSSNSYKQHLTTFSSLLYCLVTKASSFFV